MQVMVVHIDIQRENSDVTEKVSFSGAILATSLHSHNYFLPETGTSD